MTCPDCLSEQNDTAPLCSECGTALDFHRHRALSAAVIYGALIGLLVLAALGVGHLLGAEPLIV